MRVVAGDATRIEVLDGAAVVGSFVRATFTTISVDGAGGNDIILVSRANGTFTEVATLMGGAGNDTITSGNTNDTLLGGDDNDTLIWNPGEGSDIIEGGNGTRHAAVQRLERQRGLHGNGQRRARQLHPRRRHHQRWTSAPPRTWS